MVSLSSSESLRSCCALVHKVLADGGVERVTTQCRTGETCPGVQMVLKQETTSPVLRQYFREDVKSWAVIFSRIVLLTRPTSELAGFIRRQERLVAKFCVWSLRAEGITND